MPTTTRHKVIDPATPDAGASSSHSLHSLHSLRYLLYLPESYDDPAQAEHAWPLILFLHGIGESGDDISLVARYGPPAEVEKGPDRVKSRVFAVRK